MLGLAPMVYDLLDIMPLMPGMTLPMISESLIRLQLSNEISLTQNHKLCLAKKFSFRFLSYLCSSEILATCATLQSE